MLEASGPLCLIFSLTFEWTDTVVSGYIEIKWQSKGYKNAMWSGSHF
jgi:hypothetical protein